MAHDLPAASELPQVLTSRNDIAPVPVIATELMVNGLVPALVRVTTLSALMLPTSVAGNERTDGAVAAGEIANVAVGGANRAISASQHDRFGMDHGFRSE
jgi:hypothetical protein